MFRERIVATYRSWGLKGDILAVASALTVGDKAELTRELKATYSAAGASHVLALSGLHIGILTMILSWLLYPLRRIRGGKWMIGVCLVSFLWGFAFLSGLSASVVRAVTMFTVYTLASVVSEERFSGFSALSLAAFLMLVYQPMYLFDISFQLSFVAVFPFFCFILYSVVYVTSVIKLRGMSGIFCRFLWLPNLEPYRSFFIILVRFRLIFCWLTWLLLRFLFVFWLLLYWHWYFLHVIAG